MMREDFSPEMWQPKTKLGRLVKDGKITTLQQALRSMYPLKEPEIVDILLPELKDEVLEVAMVQRMTDSGRRVKFRVTTAVGNGDGFIGIATAKGREVGATIRKAIEFSKLNIREIKRGCGSWECGCGLPHSLPFEVIGKSGSVEVFFKPAPRGVGLAVGKVARKILTLAGIMDCWGRTKGQTKTTINFAKASYNALVSTMLVKSTPEQEMKLRIVSGPAGFRTLDEEEIKARIDEIFEESKEEEAEEEEGEEEEEEEEEDTGGEKT